MSLSLFFLPQNKSQQFSITEQQEKSQVKTKLLHLSTTSTQTSFIFIWSEGWTAQINYLSWSLGYVFGESMKIISFVLNLKLITIKTTVL